MTATWRPQPYGSSGAHTPKFAHQEAAPPQQHIPAGCRQHQLRSRNRDAANLRAGLQRLVPVLPVHIVQLHLLQVACSNGWNPRCISVTELSSEAISDPVDGLCASS